MKGISVISNQGEGILEKEIIYDIVEDDLTQLELRLQKTASFFINKYEKINRVVENMGIIINRFSLLK